MKTIIELSPPDQLGKPTLLALGWLDIDCPYDPKTATNLLKQIYAATRN